MIPKKHQYPIDQISNELLMEISYLFGAWKLVFGYYLEFGACHLIFYSYCFEFANYLDVGYSLLDIGY